MGLDTFASRSPDQVTLTPGDLQAFSEAGIDLCGGLFSGTSGSFRGEVYTLLILDITKVSLLQEWIPPATVRLMEQSLRNVDPAVVMEQRRQVYADLDQEYRGPELDELTVDILELRKFFGVCAERGLGLIGWY